MLFFSVYLAALVVCTMSTQDQNEQCKLNIMFEKRAYES